MALALLLAGSPCKAGEGAPALVEAGVKQAGLALAGPKPFVDIVCPIMQQQAEARGLPPMPFVRLIWKESRFNPNAVSPKGAQGIAQFSAGHGGRARSLRSVRARNWRSCIRRACLRIFAGSSAISVLPPRPITPAPSGCGIGSRARAGCRARRRITSSSSPDAPPRNGSSPRPSFPRRSRPPASRCRTSCRKLAPLVVRAVYETEPLTASGAWRPWGVQVSKPFSKAKALAQFGRLKRQYTSLLGAREPFVLPERNLSRGRRSMYMVQIGSDSRDDAAKLCASLLRGRRRLHRAEELSRRRRFGKFRVSPPVPIWREMPWHDSWL